MHYTVGIVENEQHYIDHILDQLKQIEEINNIHFWKSAEEFWRDDKIADLDIVFMDIGLPHMNGVELTKLVSNKYEELKIVMLTNMNSENIIFEAIESGAVGYILKSDMKDIKEVFYNIINGGAVITPTIALYVLNKFKKKKVNDKLTTREQQVLDLLVTGMPVKKAAGVLDISVETLRQHVKNIYRKLNVSNKVEMMRKASEMGLL